MLLAVDGLSKRFGGLRAVNEVGFRLDRGEILGLIGPNGSGKSTLMSLVMGIHRPDAGTIRFDGADIAGWPPNRVAEAGISMVSQHSRPLLQQTVLQNVQLALLPNRLLNLRLAPGIAAAARAALERVGLGDVADRLPSELPFAGLRRLELAKSLARQPTLLLLDEPFAGLSAGEVREFSALIRTFRTPERAIILVDHNVKGVRALVDRVIAMSAGSKIADDLPDHVLADETVRAVYLGGGGEVVPRPAPARREEAILRADRVSVSYGKATALREVSLAVPRGGVAAVVGLNGAGKTSLFNAICGLVPAKGGISYRGASLAGREASRIARDGVVLCPEKRELFGDMSVAENLRLGGSHLRAGELRERMDFVETLFPRLAERRGQFARTLSGGEQQQLALGRALMMKPAVLLIDEPTLGLAPIILDVISEAIEALRDTGTISLLIAEQNLTFALRHADEIHLLENGEITWNGPADRFAAEAGARVL